MQISGLGSYLATEEMARGDNRSITERLADALARGKNGDTVSISDEALARLQEAEEGKGEEADSAGKGMEKFASGTGAGADVSSAIDDLEKQLKKIMQQIEAAASGEPNISREVKIQALQTQAQQLTAQIAELKASQKAA